MKKSSRHSKITGDFGEHFLLYWLSKHGYECASVDHTGIDLIAREPDRRGRKGKVLGISVKSRSRSPGTETSPLTLNGADFEKVQTACDAFTCVPYYAIFVDAADTLECFLLPMSHIHKVFSSDPKRKWSWGMSPSQLKRHRSDQVIRRFQLTLTACSWRDAND